MVCRTTKAALQSAELGFCADLDGPLCDDCGGGLADLSSGGNDSSSDATLAGADDIELPLVASFLHAPPYDVRPCNYPDSLAVIAGFIWVQWGENRVTAVLFIPYAVWVAFASLLNYSIYRLN